MIYVKDNVERIVTNAGDAQKLESKGFVKKKEDPYAWNPPEEPEPIVEKVEPDKPQRRRRRKTKED